jgi:hypothetical protein
MVNIILNHWPTYVNLCLVYLSLFVVFILARLLNVGIGRGRSRPTSYSGRYARARQTIFARQGLSRCA